MSAWPLVHPGLDDAGTDPSGTSARLTAAEADRVGRPGWTGARAGRVRARHRARLLAVLGVACWLLLPAVSASAHAVLISTTPPAGSAAPANPPTKEVVLTFSEPVKIRFGGVRVFDAAQRPLKRVDAGEPRFVNDHTVAVGVKPLSEGSYVVAWRVVSADTHVVRGAFVFSVGTGAAPGASSEGEEIDAALGGFGPASKPVLVAASAARTLTYVAVLLLFAPLLFLLFVWRPRTPGGPADRGMVQAVARLLRRTWPGAVVANLLLVVTETAIEAGVPLTKAVVPSALGPVLGSTLGRVWIARMILLAALLPLLLRLARGPGTPEAPVPVAAGQAARSVGAMAASPETVGAAGAPSGGSPLRRGPARAAAILAAGVVVAPAFWGHATTTSPKALAVASDAVHLLSMSAWVGGLFCLLLLVPRVLREADPGERAAVLARTVPRFSNLALASVALLVASGTFLAVKHVTTWKALFDSTYGLVVVAKIVGLALALALAAFNLFRTQRRLRAAADRPEESRVWARRLRRAVGGEALITTVVIVLASVLVSLAPPRATGSGAAVGGAAAGIFSAERVPMGPDAASVDVYPTKAGQPVQVHTTFATPAGAADDAIAEVSVSLTLVDQDLGPFRYEGVKLAPGHYVVSGFSFPVPGRWRMQVLARQGEFDEYSHTFEFPVG